MISCTSPRIDRIIDKVARKLPQQNPLNYFLHNNLLAAFEDEPFWQGVRTAAALYGGRPVKDITWYFSKWTHEKIASDALEKALLSEILGLEEMILKDKVLKETVLEEPGFQPLEPEDRRELGLFLKGLMVLGPRSPLQNLERIRGINSVPTSYLQVATDEPKAVEWPLEVFEWLCRLLETYLDQGIALWHPENSGLISLAQEMLRPGKVLRRPWEKYLSQKLVSIGKGQLESPKQYLEQTIIASGLSDEVWETRFLKLCFSLRGWSGMVAKSVSEPLFFAKVPPSGVTDLILLFQILSESLGIFETKERTPQKSPWKGTSPSQHLLTRDSIREAWKMARLPERSLDQKWPTIKPWMEQLIAEMDPLKTSMIWHEAFEYTHYGAMVQRITKQLPVLSPQPEKGLDLVEGQPDYQFLVCMDDRQESLRRHIEAVVPRVVTYGVLGHFGIDMSVVPAHHPRPRQHCPPVIKPRRVLIEEYPTGSSDEGPHYLQNFSARHFHGSKTAWGGAASALILGNVALMPLLIKSMVPTLLHRFHFKWSKRLMKKPSRKRPAMRLDRYEHKVYGPCGYTHGEQAEIVAGILSQAGLDRGPFSDLLVAMGHESTGTNNPFIQAYGCGACSGHSGAANSRSFAKMFNDPQTRESLKNLGVFLPEKTRCVAAVHDTSREIIETFEDEALLDSNHRLKLSELKSLLVKTLEKNALERAPLLKITETENILKKIADRPLDLAQIRPEYGHSRTHFAFFGKRTTTQNISLERRCFLVSYDESQDKEGQVLAGLLHGALPVVANITLDYFFSSLDSRGFGSSNKVPLNVSAMLGVIQGSRGDLQVGMAEQMVEIHEPIRAFAVIEAPQEWIEKAIMTHKRLAMMVENQWLKVGHFAPNKKVSFLERGLWKPFDEAQQFPDFGSLYS